MCTNLPSCWVGALSEGLRGGDIGGFMDPRSPTDPLFFWQVFCQLCHLVHYAMHTVMHNVMHNVLHKSAASSPSGPY